MPIIATRIEPAPETAAGFLLAHAIGCARRSIRRAISEC
jgi:hypothetical protein